MISSPLGLLFMSTVLAFVGVYATGNGHFADSYDNETMESNQNPKFLIYGGSFRSGTAENNPFKVICRVFGHFDLENHVSIYQYAKVVVGDVAVFHYDGGKCVAESLDANCAAVCGEKSSGPETKFQEYELWIFRFRRGDTKHTWRCGPLNRYQYSNSLRLRFDHVSELPPIPLMLHSGALITSLPVSIDGMVLADVMIVVYLGFI